MKKMLYAKIET